MERPQMNVRGIYFTGVFIAFMAIMAQISIPMPLGVPMTMQTFAVAMAGILLGAKRGFWAALAYILLGTIGVPVFAQLMGGPHVTLGPSGGFILSFPLMAWFCGLGAERTDKKGALALGITAGVLVNYLCGLLMFMLVMGSSFSTAFLACAAPFLPTDFIKMTLAAALGMRIKRLLPRLQPSISWRR